MSTGAHLVLIGASTWFKPWFFDGWVVYWGNLCDTESAALEQAEILKRNSL